MLEIICINGVKTLIGGILLATCLFICAMILSMDKLFIFLEKCILNIINFSCTLISCYSFYMIFFGEPNSTFAWIMIFFGSFMMAGDYISNIFK